MTRFIDPNMVIVKPRFREELGDIDKLAEDIKLTGQLNPVMVEETEEGLVLLGIAAREHADGAAGIRRAELLAARVALAGAGSSP